MTAPRIATLDFVRGVAVMGILTMNIAGFALIDAAYFNPRAQGGAEGIDLAVYLVDFILFDGKMRGLFTFLFGASLLLVADRAEAKGESPLRIHYARMVWLLMFGLAHLYLVWWGDILQHYALVGMLAYPLRHLGMRAMLVAATALIAVQTLLMLGLPLSVSAATTALSDPAQAAQARATLDGLTQQFGVPEPARVAAQTALYAHGDYAQIVAARFEKHAWTPLSALFFLGMETLAYMLFGMAAFRSGLLTGGWKRRRYGLWAGAGLAIGLSAYAALALWLSSRQFDLLSVTTATITLPTPVRPVMIASWACLLILLMRPGGVLTGRIEAVGRMAFTNYLLTSLIATSLFYGYGAGLFGALSRAQLYLVVIALCAGMLLWSKPWLERFAFGPFEWLWRSLARGRAQPLTRTV